MAGPLEATEGRPIALEVVSVELAEGLTLADSLEIRMARGDEAYNAARAAEMWAQERGL